MVGYLVAGPRTRPCLADTNTEWHSGDKEQLEQLDRLVDARVKLYGRQAGGRISVRSFEVMEAPDGMVPFVGQVIVDQSGTRIDEDATGTPIYLQGEDLRRLRSLHGARIWVTGSVVGAQTLLIAHWGVLLPPTSTSYR